MPLYDDDDRLDIRPYAPIIRPVPIPPEDHDDPPLYCLAGNADWMHRLIGALHSLEQPDAWIGTDSEREAAIQNVKELLARIGPCPPVQEAIGPVFGPMAEWRLDYPAGQNGLGPLTALQPLVWSPSKAEWTATHRDDEFPAIEGDKLPAGTYRVSIRVTVTTEADDRVHLRLAASGVPLTQLRGEYESTKAGEPTVIELHGVFTLGTDSNLFVYVWRETQSLLRVGVAHPDGSINHYGHMQLWAQTDALAIQGPAGPAGEPGPAGPTMPIALRVSPLTPHAIEASYVGESGGDWWHTGLLACDIADLCQPVIDWTTTADPYPRAILQYGKPGELQDHPFPFPTPGPDFRLRVADDRTVEGRWQTGEIPSPWHDTGLEACDIVLACAIGPEDPIPPDTGPDDLCIKAYRFAEYYQNAMNDVLDTIAGESGHLQKTIGALGILSLYTGLTAPVAIGMGIGSMILEIVDGGIENTRDAFGPAYWQAYAEDLYCDMRQVLQTESYTAAHYFAWFEPWIEDHAGSLPLELWAKAILGSIHPKKANEWAAQSLTMPPAGACQNCPDLEQVLTLDFAAGIPSGVTVESGQHVEDQGLRSALWIPRDRHMNAAIVGQAAPGEAGHITRIVATIFNDGSAISYSMPLESRNSAYAFQTLGSSYTMVDQWWGLAGLNEYTFTPLSPIQISNVGLRVLFNMWTRFADQQAAEAGYSYLQTLKIYYVGDSVQWGVTT